MVEVAIEDQDRIAESFEEESPIDMAGHLAIGVTAFSRGLITVRALAETMLEIGRCAASEISSDVWLRPGRLGAGDLSMVLASLRGGLDPNFQREAAPHAPTLLGILPESGREGSDAGGQPPEGAGSGTFSSVEPVTEPDLNGVASSPPPRQASAETARYTDELFMTAGGMSRVFSCMDSRLMRRVALKAVRTNLLGDSRATGMLEREARLTAMLEHPNIIPVYDAGAREDLGPYYTMRHFDQPSLEVVIEGIKRGDSATYGQYGLGRRLRCFIQICNAIEYAHDRGVIHCDLKPANVLLGPFGEVLVADWGIARRMDELSHQVNGTPGYMAPEQFDRTRALDKRTDVFALGALLYELVCLEPAFDDAVIEETFVRLSKGLPFPPPPTLRERPGGDEIPAELAAICEKALQCDPDDRYASAGEMATALETFLEGTRERERRQQRAVQLTEEGDALAQNYRELIVARPDQVAELEILRTAVRSWEGPTTKRAVWDAEDRLKVTEALAVRTLQAAVSAYEHAIAEVPHHGAARRGLALLYWGEVLRAISRHDEFNRVYFEELVKQYDDGTIPELRRNEGYLSLASRPFDAQISISLLEQKDHRLEPRGAPESLRAPLCRLPLAPGSYLAVLSGGGLPGVKYPLLVRPGVLVDLVVDLDMVTEVDDGEIFIPGSPALIGHHDPSGEARELRTVQVPAFIIAERPVSFAEYLEFLTELSEEDLSLAERWLPRSQNGIPYWEWDGRQFVPASTTIMATAAARSLPAFGVDVAGALAYAAWKSRRTGRLYRLPFESEWEKAARGADGRSYPWGDHFDASFCKMRESRPGLPMPEPSGAFAFDVSPYGVRDMAGGVADWVLPDRGETEHAVTQHAASRGGAWCDWAADCAIGSRRLYSPAERSARIGFRLARTPEPSRASG